MNDKIIEIHSCEVCGNKDLDLVLNLGLHPMCDDLVEVGDSRICKEFPIEILFCKNCITAHQKFQVPKSELFPKTYHYRSRFTADVLNGMKDLVSKCEEIFTITGGKKVLDIGCNDGSLLDFFKEKGAITFGIEPTGAFEDALKKGHNVYNKFLDVDVAREFVQNHGHPDFICFTNVFAHIEDLNAVIESLKSLSSEGTVLIIENHYLGAVLQGNQFDTFYHEHPRTYSYTSFSVIAESLGKPLSHVEFPSRYGGNIRVFIGHSDSDKATPGTAELATREAGFAEAFAAMSEGIEKWNNVKTKTIGELIKKYGPLKAKAFPGRAAILVKLLNLNDTMISGVYEKPGSMKIGHYLPGTRIPIFSDDDLFKGNVDDPIINFAWHISKEIRTYLTKNGYKGEIVDILSAADFI